MLALPMQQCYDIGMIELKTKEHLLHYFLNQSIRLSNYDQKFLNNLEHLIHRFNRITTNQAILFDKLISKYSKQFTKAGFEKEDLKRLVWKTPVVESTPEYTGAQVSLVGNIIRLKVPFNKNFISIFRNLQDNSFEWNRNSKEYYSPLSTMALKILYHVLPNHFSSVSYSTEINEILEIGKAYTATFWNPTYVKINNNFYLLASNNILDEQVKDIPFNDDPNTLFHLSQFGIQIDESVTEGDPKKIFAGEIRPVIELDNLSTVANWLSELKVTKVYFGRGIGDAVTRKEIEAIFKKINIEYKTNSNFFSDEQTDTSSMVQLTSGSDVSPFYKGKRISKYIILLNSRPVNII